MLVQFNVYIYILVYTLCIIYNMYTAPVLLCDDGDNIRLLTELKFNLSYEVSIYRHHNVNYEYLVDIKHQSVSLPVDNRNFQDENYLSGEIHRKLSYMNESLTKIRNIEKNIQKLEPDFQSPIRAIYYPRVGK